jgi:hypothetical protein
MRLYTPARHARARAFYAREGWAQEGEPTYEPMLGLELVELRRALPPVPRSRADAAPSRP